jgi:hypothetical protein
MLISLTLCQPGCLSSGNIGKAAHGPSRSPRISARRSRAAGRRLPSFRRDLDRPIPARHTRVRLAGCGPTDDHRTPCWGLGLVLEDATSGFCDAVLRRERGLVVLEDRHWRRRSFPLGAGFWYEGSRSSSRPHREHGRCPPGPPQRSVSARPVGSPAALTRPAQRAGWSPA